MPHLGELGVDICDGRIAGFELPLWQAMQSCSFGSRSSRIGPCALCGAWQEMTRVGGDRAIAAEVRLQRYFVGCHGVGAGRPTRQRVNLSADMVRVGSWQARHICAVRTVLHQEVQRDLIDGLNMRVMAGSALNVPVDQRDLAGRVAGFALRHQRRNDVDVCP